MSSPPSGPFSETPYALTRDERRVLQECAQESFYQRCVPLMTALGLGAYYGVHLGYLRRNNNYGATPKVFCGIVIGYITGKLSYKNKCEDKILALPGGRLKESVLARRSSRQFSATPDSFGFYGTPYSYSNPPQRIDPFGQTTPSTGGNLPPYDAKSYSELDNDRPTDSFDDSFRIRPNVNDADIELTLPTQPPSYFTTYDELRRRNRDEYENKRKQYRSGPLDDHAPFSGGFAPSSNVSRTDIDDQQNRSAAFQQGFGPASFQQGPGPASFQQGPGPASFQQGPGPAPFQQGSGPAPFQQGSGPAPFQSTSHPNYSTNVQSKTYQRKNFYGDIVDK